MIISMYSCTQSKVSDRINEEETNGVAQLVANRLGKRANRVVQDQQIVVLHTIKPNKQCFKSNVRIRLKTFVKNRGKTIRIRASEGQGKVKAKARATEASNLVFLEGGDKRGDDDGQIGNQLTASNLLQGRKGTARGLLHTLVVVENATKKLKAIRYSTFNKEKTRTSSMS
jgi:hypothetical protein